ncbi:MAG: plsY [Rhodospirillales bacterium]|nr:plsY [Rhodospirillales bacterium]
MSDPWPAAATFIVAYLIGSIPFGLVLTRVAGYGDIRAIGSGNIGATNVLRTGNKLLALATLLLDFVKGVLAVLIGAAYGPDIAVVAGAGVVLGHVFPVWLRFNGGKGVATSGGVVLATSWPVGVLVVAVWIVMVAALRYSSLAALTACVAAAVLAWLLAAPLDAWLISGIALLVILRHHENIRRLLAGEESKVSFRKRS